jgi:hypothetical protein
MLEDVIRSSMSYKIHPNASVGISKFLTELTDHDSGGVEEDWNLQNHSHAGHFPETIRASLGLADTLIAAIHRR